MNRLVLLAVLMTSILISSQAQAQFFRHTRATCNKHFLPLRPYKTDKKVAQTRIVGKADPTQKASSSINSLELEKRFHIARSGIQTERVDLQNIGVHVNNAGQAKFSGKLNHNAGPDGGLTGSNVTVHVRFYGGVAGAAGIEDAVLLWEMKKNYWCYKDRQKTIAISSLPNQVPRLKRVFAKITHVEIELEHEIDR